LRKLMTEQDKKRGYNQAYYAKKTSTQSRQTMMWNPTSAGGWQMWGTE